MELHQLQYFESVARHLHFTRAAEELNVAQPSVSQQIRKLEAELGVPLFHRMKRRVALTEAGALFLPRARATLQLLDEARAELQEVVGMRKGTLSLGATPSVGTHLMPAAIAAFNRQQPGIALSFREGGSRTLVTMLLEGELDLAVVIQPVRNSALQATPLLREELLLAVPRDHALARRQSVSLAELRDEPFVMLREGSYDLRDQAVAACRRAGFTPRVVLDGAEMDSVPRFVAAGVGLTILPALVLRDMAQGDGPVAVRIQTPRLMRSLVVAHRRDRYFSSAAREFSRVLRELVASA
ncbi:MAG TPA: LysR substrate-binding domain-containing protein [Dehalococcoidia bacterium]|jgi:LysR family transcriptional activator of glutamate synthase operon|nr:LysR substrate-binding domain-containing protein [Dehalococcoidia bacterium]